MEKKVSLFLDRSQVSFVTDKINGFLNAIIIDSNNNVDLIIESSLGYLVMKDKAIMGAHYICPRQRTQCPEKSLFDYPEHDKFMLNEELIITVNGPKNTTVHLTFRIEDLYNNIVNA